MANRTPNDNSSPGKATNKRFSGKNDKDYNLPGPSQSRSTTFNERGQREGNSGRGHYQRPSPYDNLRSRGPGRYHLLEGPYDKNYSDNEYSASPMSPLELKIENLISAVQSQPGVRGRMVLMESDPDNSIAILQNAVNSLYNVKLDVVEKTFRMKNYVLKIGDEAIVEGFHFNRHIAKTMLCEEAVKALKKKCFYLIKKKNYEEVNTEDLLNKKVVPVTSPLEGSKAHQMMLKMGWSGKGLGSQEQGEEQSLADKLTQNVTRVGFGSAEIVPNKIKNLLEDFARSDKVTTLAFDTGFTKNERALIHLWAQKFNLKSKSEGLNEARRITISKKIGRWVLVKELLLANCENNSYVLIIPSDFIDLWNE